MSSKIQQLLENMWQDYIKLNPQANEIYGLFKSREGDVVNDHIALRTYNDKRINIGVLARIFIDNGFKEAGEYHFEQKKLYAKHFQHDDDSLPKIFISELLVDQLSQSAQQTIKNLIDQMDVSITKKENFLYSGRPWNIDYKTYEILLNESEYAGWMAAHGFRPNHFTVSINALKTFKGIEEVNQFLKDNGHKLNDSGGEIKGSKEVLLEQSSTMANKVMVSFDGEDKEIPSCYYEFAKRYADDSGKLYQGFVAKSADKIFESTDTKN